MSLLEKSILATVVYYDVLDYPLTGFEVFKYLINPSHIIAQFYPHTQKATVSKGETNSRFMTTSLKELRSLGQGVGVKSNKAIETEPIPKISFLDVLKTLKERPLKNFIEEKNGLYFLKGKGNLAKQRIERQKIASPRWKKVYRVIKFLQICPFIKMIAVCNSLAIDNSKTEADIDFFIVVKKARIWLTRFLITFIVWSLREWRHGKNIAGKICLSFYITVDALNLEPITIRPYDIYLAHWLCQLKPVYSQGKIYKEFILKNQWAKTYLLNFGNDLDIRHPEFKKNKFLSAVQRLSEEILGDLLGDLIEKLLRAIQKYKISSKITNHKIPTAVIVSDKILKFHENDRREFFQEKFKQRLKILTSNIN